MDSRSRLPRAASNPTIRAPPTTSTVSRLPAPVRLVRQTTVSRKPSIPLRTNRKITPNDGEIVSSTASASEGQAQKTLPSSSPAPVKRPLPSRSTLGLNKTFNSAPSRPASKILDKPLALGPKRTVSSVSTHSRTTSSTSSSTNLKQQENEDGGKPKDIFSKSSSTIANAQNEYPNKLQRLNPLNNDRNGVAGSKMKLTQRKSFLGLGSPSRPSRPPTTPSSRPATKLNTNTITQTPAFPRLASVPWTPHHPDEQLKDLEFSFTADEDESNDQSFIEALDFGFATSRFNQSKAKPLDQLIPLSERNDRRSDPRYDGRRTTEGEELSCWRRQEVRTAWATVIDAGQGDLEEVRNMRNLLYSLMADLEIQEKGSREHVNC